ncbi:hypothetical protein ESY86_16580 [Subsaximicrobium wynnwilliamsii]|uniref:Four helix bundle protein n=1 Tax=Subsaximicrobium wynnwilliamsii TaxID=291179 RepID=A0A5C6ZDB1_9FLAO|nr:hypothetical protein [Subsaximicrobium wynnwilliamsii]TXD81841.1 hypothetical protein ESY87_16480 [Subsaximicrobium wynnwilliamsii]TXD87510.1 hypothetical protein ESY86_16580 [Subsaximicrobium wynnwilliamsii]TXE01193.1 hypothetical protein ESY88_16830 [Subsaximicrobium wynnwilliamsii]
MYYNLPSHLSDLPIYRKAMDILMLSRNISTYLSQDLSYLNPDGSEDAHIYFSGDIIQQSESLVPEIEKAQAGRYSEKKDQHLASIERLTQRLHINCNRLERCNSNGSEYLPILRSELRKFRKLQRHWVLTL